MTLKPEDLPQPVIKITNTWFPSSTGLTPISRPTLFELLHKAYMAGAEEAMNRSNEEARKQGFSEGYKIGEKKGYGKGKRDANLRPRQAVVPRDIVVRRKALGEKIRKEMDELFDSPNGI